MIYRLLKLWFRAKLRDWRRARAQAKRSPLLDEYPCEDCGRPLSTPYICRNPRCSIEQCRGLPPENVDVRGECLSCLHGQTRIVRQATIVYPAGDFSPSDINVKVPS